VKDALYGAKNFKTKDKSNSSMMVFGFGDGGGGPDRAMLERLSRLKDVDGIPKIEQKHPSDHFQQMIASSPDLPVWVGELVLNASKSSSVGLQLILGWSRFFFPSSISSYIEERTQHKLRTN